MASRAPLPPGYPPTSGAVPQQDLVVQLEGMGFSRELAEQAVLGTQGESLQAALDLVLTTQSSVGWLGVARAAPCWAGKLRVGQWTKCYHRPKTMPHRSRIYILRATTSMILLRPAIPKGFRPS